MAPPPLVMVSCPLLAVMISVVVHKPFPAPSEEEVTPLRMAKVIASDADTGRYELPVNECFIPIPWSAIETAIRWSSRCSEYMKNPASSLECRNTLSSSSPKTYSRASSVFFWLETFLNKFETIMFMRNSSSSEFLYSQTTLDGSFRSSPYTHGSGLNTQHSASVGLWS